MKRREKSVKHVAFCKLNETREEIEREKNNLFYKLQLFIRISTTEKTSITTRVKLR